ncbi:hypothetical protein FXO37_26094 [Capsicum annuum]|nr:hypothetical protein FXO37_26094 [Capsicum annuum]
MLNLYVRLILVVQRLGGGNHSQFPLRSLALVPFSSCVPFPGLNKIWNRVSGSNSKDCVTGNHTFPAYPKYGKNHLEEKYGIHTVPVFILVDPERDMFEKVLALDGFSMCSCRPLVSRARAMMWSDILATGKPCIVIPSPDMAEGHQFHNACLMADSRVMIKNELDSLTLKNTIEEILETITDEGDAIGLETKRKSSSRLTTSAVQNVLKL